MAAGVFLGHLPLAERFAELLATDGVVRGLIGPREAPRLWERHLVNCALLGRALPEGSDVCDIGSGAGLPGLVLALSRPDLQVTLVEPLLRRTTFLEEAFAALELGNVEVVRARAEELHGTREFGVVTSRAVAPLERLARWSLPLVRLGGEMVAMKGSGAEAEIEAAQEVLRALGAGLVRVEEYGAETIDPPTRVIRVEATLPSGLRWGPTGSGEGRGAGREGKRKRGSGRAPTDKRG